MALNEKAHYWVHPNGQHYRLSLGQIDQWARDISRGLRSATLENPPDTMQTHFTKVQGPCTTVSRTSLRTEQRQTQAQSMENIWKIMQQQVEMSMMAQMQQTVGNLNGHLRQEQPYGTVIYSPQPSSQPAFQPPSQPPPQPTPQPTPQPVAPPPDPRPASAPASAPEERPQRSSPIAVRTEEEQAMDDFWA
ncbi:hypothetical protein OEA41_001149 [Lepraria neglecta]|uniref:Uncharacterized protein n=1 Tax=Lepraria neglecta TaxID=209136 RepID=A0AAD9ZHT9_9LECA|nr:hypothetical protein OEA41_001149 [Lepraria neglecta]